MRQRLTLLVLAVTSLVVIAYTVPLALLVRTQADERARVNAERLVQDVARSMVPVSASTGRVDLETIAPAIVIPPRVSIVDSTGAVAGDTDFDLGFARSTVTAEASASRYADDGSWQVSLPVIGREGWAVVSVTVEREELTSGVMRAWLFLGLMGAMLILTALVLADRLGRSLRDPVEQLAEAARRIGAGELDLRVERPDITELSTVADALNRLAPQLRNLMASEREVMADLSHRLRTPLAALRLQAEAIQDPEERAEMLALIDRMQSSVDRLIVDARAIDSEARCDLSDVARRHAEFWSVLAEEEHRSYNVEIEGGAMPVGLSEDDLGDAIDVVIGNVFSHTPRGTDLSLLVRSDGFEFVVAVEDAGSGFPVGVDPLRRGASGGGSTGLGLDIARRAAERVGGSILLGNSPLGGARVELRFPPAG